jgi:hypothetical protein
MAVSLDPDTAAATAILALITADNDTLSAVALNNPTQTVSGTYDSANYLVGRFTRWGDPKRSPNVPRIEVQPVTTGAVDSFGAGRFSGVVRLHIFTNRETPDGFASQTAIAMRTRTVINRVTPSTAGGWTFSRLGNGRGFQAPSTDKEQHYVVEYPIQASAGAGSF